MATKEYAQPFTPQGEYVVRKKFTFNGVNYATGDVFSPAEADCPERRLRQLYDGRFIQMPPSAVEEPKEVPFTFDPEVHKVRKDEAGEWFIHDGDTKVLKVTRMEGKRLRKVDEETETEGFPV